MSNSRTLAVLVWSISGATASAGSELVLIRSGVEPVTCTGQLVCCAPLQAEPFGPEDFAAALAGPPAPLSPVLSLWVDELDLDSSARWIAPGGSGGFVIGSALYATEFEVQTEGDPLGTITLAWAADDRIGDLDGEPNEVGLYLNGAPLSAGFRRPTTEFGGSVQRTVEQQGVPLRTGTNTLHIYQRDTGAGWSGLLFAFQARIGDCAPVVRYCESLPGSTGVPARLEVLGSRSVTANDTALEVTGCPPGTFYQFFYGEVQVAYPFGNGVLCISPFAPGLHRLGEAGLTDGAGSALEPIDFEALSPHGLIQPDSTWNFQMIYRDPAGGGAGFNTSDALSVPFCP